MANRIESQPKRQSLITVDAMPHDDDDDSTMPHPPTAGGPSRSGSASISATVGEAVADEPVRPLYRVFLNRVDSWVAQRMMQRMQQMQHSPNPNPDPDNTPATDPASTGHTGSPTKTKNFAFVGTLSSHDATPPPGVEVVSADAEGYLPALEASDWVIFDINSGDAAVRHATDAFNLLKTCKPTRGQKIKFALLSTFMTWSMTPVCHDKPLPFTEDEFRGRKPHPHFSQHLECEMKLVDDSWTFHNSETFPHEFEYTSKFAHMEMVVLTCGLLYGEGERIFDVFFRKAWETSDSGVPIIGDGDNKFPTIHVTDFVNITVRLLSEPVIKPYAVVCDSISQPQSTSLGELINSVAGAFGDEVNGGHVEHIPESDAFFLDELDQLDIDKLTANISMASSFRLDYVDWIAPDGIVANIVDGGHASCTKQYTRAHSIDPIRVVVVGPPSSGKTELCENLARTYNVIRVHAQAAIAFGRMTLTRRIEEQSPEFEEEIDAADPEKVEKEASKKRFNEMKQELASMSSIDTFPDHDMQRYFKMLLNSKTCLNQGYVLDGYPKSAHKTKSDLETDPEALYGTLPSDKKQTKGGAEEVALTHLSPPGHVFIFHASEAALRERLLGLPQSELDRSDHNCLDEFTRRWARFVEGGGSAKGKEAPSGGEAMARLHDIEQYFKHRNNEFSDGLVEVHVIEDIMRSKKELANQIIGLIGRKNRAIGLKAPAASEPEPIVATVVAEAVDDPIAQDERALQEVVDSAEKFLNKHVMPQLALSLLEVVKAKPDDPIKFLSDLLKSKASGPTFMPLPDPAPHAESDPESEADNGSDNGSDGGGGGGGGDGGDGGKADAAAAAPA